MSDDAGSREGDAVGARWPELIVALVLMVLGAMVIADSLRVGIGWADDGPRSGYFPFYIGLALLGSSGWVFVKQLLRWKTDKAVFAERQQAALVLAMLWPMTVYVAAIFVVGIYLASALLIGYFMRRYGKYGWALTGAVSAGVPLFFFFVFERWFLVQLPKGPIERLMGL
jgi:putative tricarboxylic transport membrane protein